MSSFENPPKNSERTKTVPHSLLKPWPELPSGFVSVFHYTDQESLETIAKLGLTHFSDRTPDTTYEEKERVFFDELCDQIAREIGIDFKRSKAVFAALPSEIDTAKWSKFGDVRLEIKVDKETSYVYDRELHSAAVIAFYRTPEGRSLLEQNPGLSSEARTSIEKMAIEKFPHTYRTYLTEYLQKRVRLSDYLGRSMQEQTQLIRTPEIGLIGPINPEMIRLAIEHKMAG